MTGLRPGSITAVLVPVVDWVIRKCWSRPSYLCSRRLRGVLFPLPSTGVPKWVGVPQPKLFGRLLRRNVPCVQCRQNAESAPDTGLGTCSGNVDQMLTGQERGRRRRRNSRRIAPPLVPQRGAANSGVGQASCMRLGWAPSDRKEPAFCGIRGALHGGRILLSN